MALLNTYKCCAFSPFLPQARMISLNWYATHCQHLLVAADPRVKTERFLRVAFSSKICISSPKFQGMRALLQNPQMWESYLKGSYHQPTISGKQGCHVNYAHNLVLCRTASPQFYFLNTGKKKPVTHIACQIVNCHIASWFKEGSQHGPDNPQFPFLPFSHLTTPNPELCQVLEEVL